jgi:hypothetical protein
MITENCAATTPLWELSYSGCASAFGAHSAVACVIRWAKSVPRSIGARVGIGFELAWRPPTLDDGLHLPRAPRRSDLPVQGPALAKAGDGMLPSDFCRRNVVLSLQEGAVSIRLSPPFSPPAGVPAGGGEG